LAAANKNRTQRWIDGLSHVDCIDLVVGKGTRVPGVEEIAISWRGCLTAHHRDLEIQAALHIITEKEIKDSREPLQSHFGRSRNSIVYTPSSDHNSMWFCYATRMALRFTIAGMNQWRMLIKTAGSG